MPWPHCSSCLQLPKLWARPSSSSPWMCQFCPVLVTNQFSHPSTALEAAPCMLALWTHRIPSWAVCSPDRGHTASRGRVGLWPDCGPAHSSSPKPGACAQVPAATPAWCQSTQASCPARTVSENPASTWLPLPSGETRCPLRPSLPPPTSTCPHCLSSGGPQLSQSPPRRPPWVSLHPVHLGWVQPSQGPFYTLVQSMFLHWWLPEVPRAWYHEHSWRSASAGRTAASLQPQFSAPAHLPLGRT